MSTITEAVLTKLEACEDGKKWWLRNVGEGFPVTRLRDIKGGYNGYIDWLKDKFYNCTYDQFGNKLTYKDRETYKYDQNGRLLEVKYKEGDKKEYTYHQGGYDVLITYVEGTTTTEKYNTLGKITTRVVQGSRETEWVYDAHGRPLKYITSSYDDTWVHGGYWEEWIYDDNNKSVKRVTSTGDLEKYTYDSNGNETSYTSSYGLTRKTEYDPNGNVVYREHNGCPRYFIYDMKQNLIEHGDGVTPPVRITYEVTKDYLKVNNCIIPLDWKHL